MPGALLRNASLRFAGQEVMIAAERLDTPFTHLLDARRPLRMPVAHGEGRFYADDATLDALERDGQVLFSYVDRAGTPAGPDDPGNPNGSLRGDRRRPQRRRERGGPDAPPGTGIRGHPRVGGRLRDHPLAGRQRGTGRQRRPGRGRGHRRRRGVAMTVAERPVEPLHHRLGVTDDELHAIRGRLGGRDPNDLELAMFSVMWSEHCSYKSSKPLLRTLPTAGAGRRRGPGRERRGHLDR